MLISALKRTLTYSQPTSHRWAAVQGARLSSSGAPGGGRELKRPHNKQTTAQVSVDDDSNESSAPSTADSDALELEGFQPRFLSSGVFRESEDEDIKVLINNYTCVALARALRERESTLQAAAYLASSGNYGELAPLLSPFEKDNVARRRKKRHSFDFASGFTRRELVIIQRYLHRMPRQVFNAAEKRASVVIPLCNVGGVASVLFERRSSKVRTHKQQVCFPGGMVEEGVDTNIIQTSLRETEEELGIPAEHTEVLGILRCNWSEVASMTGIAVTPVVGFIGEINDLKLTPNPDEVEQLFTVSMEALLDKTNWSVRDSFSTPVFTGGPFVIWGLTAYLLDRLIKEIILKVNIRAATTEGK